MSCLTLITIISFPIDDYQTTVRIYSIMVIYQAVCIRILYLAAHLEEKLDPMKVLEHFKLHLESRFAREDMIIKGKDLY